MHTVLSEWGILNNPGLKSSIVIPKCTLMLTGPSEHCFPKRSSVRHDSSYKGLFTWTRDSELPRGNDCPGASVTSRSHDDLFPRGKFIVIWSLRTYLNFFSFYTNCYREWILKTFTYFWCFLEIFIEKFILNINNEHAQDYSCPRATFAFCSHREKLPRQGGLPGVVQRVTRLSKLPRGNENLMWTVTGVRPCTEAKLTPGSVSCPGAMSCPGFMWTGP